MNHNCAWHRGKDPASSRIPGVSASTRHRTPTTPASIPHPASFRRERCSRRSGDAGTHRELPGDPRVSRRERGGPQGGDRPQWPLSVPALHLPHSMSTLTSRTQWPHSPPALSVGSPVPHSPLSVPALGVPRCPLGVRSPLPCPAAAAESRRRRLRESPRPPRACAPRPAPGWPRGPSPARPSPAQPNPARPGRTKRGSKPRHHPGAVNAGVSAEGSPVTHP